MKLQKLTQLSFLKSPFRWIPLLWVFSVLSILTPETIYSQRIDIKSRLKALKGIRIEEIKPDSGFQAAFKIYIHQPIDHHFPGGKFFEQKLYLSHRSISAPMVVVTAGYQAPHNAISEIARLLKANQILIEHRYFGDSVPDSLDWRYLTVWQAANDDHRIVELFKRIYRSRWVSTGRSKGGQTALFYKRFFPNDVAATVAFVAPLNLTREDNRITYKIKTLGTPGCRKRIEAFQKLVLGHRAELLKRFNQHRLQHHYQISISMPVVLEYSVLEFPFSFWQWGNVPCDSIPTDTTAMDVVFSFLIKIVPYWTLFTDKAIRQLEPAMFQFYSELGYYNLNYNSPQIMTMLKVLRHPSYDNFTPKNVVVQFRPQTMWDIIPWLQYQGNNIIYIYGGRDPWEASAIQLSPFVNARKFVKPDANHSVRLADFSGTDRNEILKLLEEWLQVGE